jgi:membrane protein required for colicin V production
MTGFDIAVLLMVGVGAIAPVSCAASCRKSCAGGLDLRAFRDPLPAHAADAGFSSRGRHGIGRGGAGLRAAAAGALCRVKLVAGWAGARSRNSLLGPIDRVLGFGFGAVKGMIIVVLAFSVLVLGYDTVWGVGGRPTWITQARTYPFVNASSEALVTMIASAGGSEADGRGGGVGG